MVCCLLFVVVGCWLLVVDCLSLVVVCCLFDFGCWLLIVVCCLCFGVWRLWFVV